MDVNLINAEVLRVAPDEVLVIKLPKDWPQDDDHDIVAEMITAIERVGLGGRCMVVAGELEMAVVPRSSAKPAFPPDNPNHRT